VNKIPTLFVRDWEGNRQLVTQAITPGCEWVMAGEGIATRKYDGSCCLMGEGKLYKRHEVREGKQTPLGFAEVDFDEMTGKHVGWVPVGGGPEDKWHREALVFTTGGGGTLPDGTYELVGPKVQGNPEQSGAHALIKHSAAEVLADAPRAFDELKAYLAAHDIEGIVWWHPDGRMAKIKGRDFGIKRGGRGA
jgi:hypothetical protein